MNEWKEVSLGEITKLSTKKVDANHINIDQYISTDNLLPNLGGIEIAKSLPNQNKYASFEIGDVLFSNIRTYFKKVWQASFKGGCSNDVLVFKAKDNTCLSQDYLYYLISNQLFIDYTSFTAKGTKMPRGDKEAIKKYRLKLPTISEQNEIAKTLSNLDKKITLLRQQNQDLEELAQTLFKRWFVEFEFPCLPSGYRPQGQVNLSSLAKVCTYKRVGGLPVPDGKSWFTYVLLCEDGSFYKGMTNDLYRRFYEHYIGEGANHTKTHKPVKVIHWEQFNTQDEARKREEELKTGYGRTWLQREYDKLLKYGSVASDGLPAQNEGSGLPAQNEGGGLPAQNEGSGLPAHQTRLMTAGKMVESELGEIPEGWRVGKLGEIIINHDSKRIPLSSNERAERKGKYPYHGATSIMDYVDDYIFDGRYLLLGEDGSVVDENGYPILQFVEGKIWVNNHAHVLEGKHPFSTNYIFLQLRRTKVNHIVTGAVQLKINQSNLNSLEMLIPTQEITEKFDDTTKEVFNKLFHNTEEIQTLTQLRDTLLPKLMSGELRVK